MGGIVPVAVERSKPGTVAALVASYYRSSGIPEPEADHATHLSLNDGALPGTARRQDRCESEAGTRQGHHCEAGRPSRGGKQLAEIHQDFLMRHAMTRGCAQMIQQPACANCAPDPAATGHGPKKRSNNSMTRIRLAARRGLPWTCCSIPGSGGRTWCRAGRARARRRAPRDQARDRGRRRTRRAAAPQVRDQEHHRLPHGGVPRRRDAAGNLPPGAGGLGGHAGADRGSGFRHRPRRPVPRDGVPDLPRHARRLRRGGAVRRRGRGSGGTARPRVAARGRGPPRRAGAMGHPAGHRHRAVGRVPLPGRGDARARAAALGRHRRGAAAAGARGVHRRPRGRRAVLERAERPAGIGRRRAAHRHVVHPRGRLLPAGAPGGRRARPHAPVRAPRLCGRDLRPRVGGQPALPGDARSQPGGGNRALRRVHARRRGARRRQVRRLAQGRARHRPQHCAVRRARMGAAC